MNTPVYYNTAYINTECASPKQQMLEEAIAEDRRFAKVLERFDAEQETDEERRKRLQAEDEQALERNRRRQKMNELQALIAELRSKLASSGGKDPGIEARLSAAQTELFWLMFSF